MSDKKKALIVGLGSIGCKHADILIRMGWDVDAWRKTTPNTASFSNNNQFDTRVYSIWNKEHIVRNKYDLIIVSNPTEHHISTVLDLQEIFDPTPTILLEKPICMPTIDDMFKADKILQNIYVTDTNIYVGYNLRYDNELMNIAGEEGKFSKTRTHEAVCKADGLQWDSDRSLDHVAMELSHEIDYLIMLFGMIETVHVRSDAFAFKTSMMIVEFEHISGYTSRVILDYFSGEEERYLKSYHVNGLIRTTPVGSQLQDTYRKQLYSIINHTYPENSFIDSLHTMEVIGLIMNGPTGEVL